LFYLLLYSFLPKPPYHRQTLSSYGRKDATKDLSNRSQQVKNDIKFSIQTLFGRSKQLFGFGVAAYRALNLLPGRYLDQFVRDCDFRTVRSTKPWTVLLWYGWVPCDL